MCYATFLASAETSLVRSECATALRVREFDKGRGLVGFPPIGQACDLPVWSDQVLARIPLSNYGAADQHHADAHHQMLPPCSKIVAGNNYASRRIGIRRHKLTHLGIMPVIEDQITTLPAGIMPLRDIHLINRSNAGQRCARVSRETGLGSPNLTGAPPIPPSLPAQPEPADVRLRRPGRHPPHGYLR